LPTKSHRELAEILSTRFDEVWFVPCFQSLYGKSMASYDHRLAMSSLLITRPNIKVSDFERGLSGTTYDLLTKLIATHPQHRFTFVIGLDNANKFPGWYRANDLERLVPFLVFKRKGYEENPEIQWYKNPPHTFIDLSTEHSISSTQAREAVRGVDEAVLRYAFDNKLY